MRTALIAALALAALPCLAGEQPRDPAKAKARAERLAQVGAEVARIEGQLGRWPVEKIAAQKAADAKAGNNNGKGANMERERARNLAALPALHTELSWIKGDLTKAKAAAAVKAAEEALAKAGEADKPKAQAALDEAKAALETVKALEVKGDF